jgi:type I restriction enzyme S subunit
MRGPIDVNELRLTSPEVESEFRRSRVQPGDLVMAIRGSVGRVQIVPPGPEIMNVTRDAARIAVSPDLAFAPYIRHALATRRAQDWLRLRLTGSAVKGINIGDLRKVPVSVLPISAQVDVAEVLDASERELWHAHDLMRRSLALLDERKQALITAAVTGAFDVATARGVA